MNSLRHPLRSGPRSRQRGMSTLIIAILLLGIVTVITIFAARVGIFEQRISSNEYRYKMAFQVAEAGLNQSMEFVKLNTRDMLSEVSGGWLFPGDPHWQPCTEALPAGMAVDPCLAEPDASRRDDMYRYVGPDGSAEDGILPVADVMPALDSGTGENEVGGFAAEYATYATLCRLDLTIPESPRCSLSPATGDVFYVTLVSEGTLTDEGAEATVKQSFGTFRLLGNAPDAPLIAAGTAIGLGNAQIVPNPDGGGFGVPISIWSKGDAQVDGASFATCQLGEWLANYGNPAPSQEDLINGVCESCSCNGLCPGYGLLSGNAMSCAAAKDKLEGEDILDVDGGASDASPKVVDSKYFPTDLFAYIFGIPDSNSENFLEQNATKVADCGTITADSAGLLWYPEETGCDIGDAGSLADPVVIVSDGPVSINAGSQIFGIIYVRDESGESELLKATGTPQIYGSVILEGDAKMGGTPTIIYNEAVLTNIRNSPEFLRYGPVPGSWNDALQ